MEAADEYAAKADTAQSRDVRKSLEERRDESLDHAKEYRKEFDRINKMDFKDIKKMALDEYGSWLKSSKAEKRAVRAWNIFFIILIPVYIFAERPYGYTMTRTRAESSTLRGISKFTYALSAMMMGSAASISWIQTVRKYSDGRTESTFDAGTNAPVMIMKACLYIAAFDNEGMPVYRCVCFGLHSVMYSDALYDHPGSQAQLQLGAPAGQGQGSRFFCRIEG